MEKETLKYERISRKLLKTFFKILILSFLILFLFLLFFFYHILRNEIRIRANEYATFVKNLVYEGVLNYNLYEVGKVVNSEMGQKNVLFIAVFDKDKNLMTSNLYYVENRDRLSKNENFKTDKVIVRIKKFSIFSGEKNGYVDVFLPILNADKGKIGYLHVGMVFPSFVKLYRTIFITLAIFIIFITLLILYFFGRSISLFEKPLDEIFNTLNLFLSGYFSVRANIRTNTQIDLIVRRLNLLFKRFVEKLDENEKLLKKFDSELNKKNLILIRTKEFYEDILDKIGDYVYVLDSSGFIKFANSNFKSKIKNYDEVRKVPLLIYLKDRVRSPFNIIKNFLKAHRGENVFFKEDVRDFDGNLVSFDIFMTPIEGFLGERNVLVVGRESLQDVVKEGKVLDVDSLLKIGKTIYIDFKFLESLFKLGYEKSEIENFVESILKRFEKDFVIRASGFKNIELLSYLDEKVDVLRGHIPIEDSLLLDRCSVSVEKSLLNDYFLFMEDIYGLFQKEKRIRKVLLTLDRKVFGGKDYALIKISFLGIKFDRVLISPYELLSKKIDIKKSDIRFFLLTLPLFIKAYENFGFLKLDKRYSSLTIELLLPLKPEIKRGKKKNKVLLIDDEESIVEVVRDYLNEFGYGVYTANCGEDGLEIFKKRSQEILAVIVDIMMPGMGGKRTYEEIRKLSRDVYIFFASGYSGDDFSETDLKGDNRLSFLNKPFDFDELIKKLDSLKKA